MRLCSVPVAITVVLFLALPAGAEPSRLLTPPVDGAITRPFDPPASEFGAGHRGVDYAVAYGTQVRAAASGTVVFAGNVAGIMAVTIDHGGGLETTYTRLAGINVARGERVTRGQFIGTAGEAHPGVPGLHFAVKVDETYVDPETMLGPIGLADAIHLVSVDGSTGKVRSASCRTAPRIRSRPPPPDDNIAVAVAGINSATAKSDSDVIYAPDPVTLGYRPGRVYDFSYRGIHGPHLHKPYASRATFTDIRKSATRLAHLLEAIARRHPGTDVDLIAHSQGGIVARTLLELQAGPFSSRLPHVDHLVTFSSPHSGAPLASSARAISSASVTGGLVASGLSAWAQHGGPVPDPFSPAMSELAPDSSLMDALAAHDVVYGTRVLALGTPTDYIVPADRSRWEGKYSRTISPVISTYAHVSIVTSPAALATAYSFLRDAPRTCSGVWDGWGPVVGRGVGALESAIPGVVAALTP